MVRPGTRAFVRLAERATDASGSRRTIVSVALLIACSNASSFAPHVLSHHYCWHLHRVDAAKLRQRRSLNGTRIAWAGYCFWLHQDCLVYTRAIASISTSTSLGSLATWFEHRVNASFADHATEVRTSTQLRAGLWEEKNWP